MNIVFMNPKSGRNIFMVAHVTQFWKILLVSSLSNQVLPAPPVGTPELGLQAPVGTLCVQSSPDVLFFFPLPGT